MDVRSLLLLTLLLACVSSLLQSPRKNNLLRIIHQWTFANFNYNSTQDRLSAEQLGYLTPGNVAILDGDYYIDPKTHKMRIFVTTPQFLPGTPATFYEIRDQKRDEPVMSPFPSWESQNIAACSGPISVYRVLIDKCGLLWVLDTGMVETFMVPKRACKPKILIYDLNKNDELIARYEFPEGVLDERSIVINLITESYQKDCKDSIAYIADVQARGLIMFDWPKRTSWRVENTYFYPFPDQAIVRILNTTFQLMDGLFGLALSPATDRQRKLYFHSAASIRESWISTSALKNTSIISDTDALRREFHHSEDLRVGQSTVEVMTEDGILIYAVLNKNALACWNQAHPLKKEFQHVIYEDNDNLQFVSGMKLKDKTLMITSSKLQNYIMLQANGTDVKYRVMIIDNVDKLLDNSPCRKGEKGPILAETEGSSYYPTTPKHTTCHHIHHEDTILPETERWSYHPTTPKHTTSHHIHIDHKHSTSTPLRDEIDDKQPVFFHPPHKNHGHPPYWHQGHEPASVQKQIPHEQTTHSTFQFDDSHLNNPTAESKHQSTSSDQQSPQAPKSPTNPTSRDPADHNVSSRAEQLSAESSERESRTRPSVFSKPILYQSPEELSRHRHDQLNNLELD